jgi:hypothetical protein
VGAHFQVLEVQTQFFQTVCVGQPVRHLPQQNNPPPSSWCLVGDELT